MTETQLLISNLGALSYVGIFGISILANVIIPVPEEVVILAIGYVARVSLNINVFTVVPVVILGLLVSDVGMYYLAKKGARPVLYFYNKFFSKRVASRRLWLESHIEKVIFFSRFMVQLRFIGPFMAGQMKVPLKKFLTYELLALVIYVPLLVWAGWYFRNRFEQITGGISMARNVILMIVGILLLVFFFKLIRKAIFGRNSSV